MAHNLEIFGSVIVALGQFNPRGYTPDWMEAHNLIGKDDAQLIREGGGGTDLIISSKASKIETTWFSLEVAEDRMNILSKDVLSPTMKDLAVGIFQLLPESPVTGLGMNFYGHYKISTSDERHKIGDTFAPKELWNEIFPDIDVGLTDLSIQIQPGVRGEEVPKSRDAIRVSIQPSAKIKQGIYLSYNDHHELIDEREEIYGTGQIIAKMIDEQWQIQWDTARTAFEKILTLPLRGA